MRVGGGRSRPAEAVPAEPGPVVVIGGGISGLATAALLARDGHEVTLLEAREGLGGRAGRWQAEGFSFDTGPSWYLMPEVIDHWFKLMGTSADAQLRLTALEPAYRTWFEGYDSPLEVSSGAARSAALFESVEPGAGRRLETYLESAEEAYTLAKRHFLYDGFASLRGLAAPAVLRRAPRLARLLGTSLEKFAAARFTDPRLRQLLGYPAVFLGTSPAKAPALYHLMSHLDLSDGVQYPLGGFAALIDAMEAVARSAGVTIVPGARARRIIVTGPSKAPERSPGRQLRGAARPRCEAVEWTAPDGSVHRTPARTVVGAIDLHHLETELLDAPLQTHPEQRWRRRDPGPSAVLVCLGIRGPLPELAHHNLLFAADWKDNFGRIDAGRPLAQTTSLYVCRPSATDPTVAPPGCENLFLLVPAPAIPEWGHGGYDGGGSPQVEKVAEAAITQLQEWTGTGDLRERILVRRTWGPADFRDGLNAWRGSALGPGHTLRQSAFLRPGNRSAKVSGLYYAGSSVRPGIGVPMCLISAELVLKAIRRDTSSGPLPEPAGVHP